MYVNTWDPKITGRAKDNRIAMLRFFMRASLACPCCGLGHLVETKEWILVNPLVPSSQVELPSALDSAINNLASRRDCDKCGVTSVIPKDHLTRLRAEAEKRVTAEWVEARKQEIISSASAE
ncbi:MAG: hypothetical protein JWN49_136 [Parcubacteria group bacterium]|nr:hypothetical protein [Parcubacteria group bacterium]